METVNTKRKDGQLLLMFILFVVFQAASILFAGFEGYFDLSWTVESVMMAVVCCLIYCSYRSHTKNVMKPLLGATLMLILYYTMYWALDYVQYFGDYLEWYNNDTAFLIYIICDVALFVVLALINIMHYSINASHHSSPKKIKTNRVFHILFAAITIAQCICCLFLEGSANWIISDFAGSIADVFMLAMVIIVESSLDEFRIERESKAEAAEEAKAIEE